MAGAAGFGAGAEILNIVIRAIDYCPPFHCTFGEYLRALITADYDLVGEEGEAYREVIVGSFRRYGVTVPDVPTLSVESLLWKPPQSGRIVIPQLRFRNLGLTFDDGFCDWPQDDDGTSVRRAAQALGNTICTPKHAHDFGLVEPGGCLRTAAALSLRTLRTVSLRGDALRSGRRSGAEGAGARRVVPQRSISCSLRGRSAYAPPSRRSSIGLSAHGAGADTAETHPDAAWHENSMVSRGSRIPREQEPRSQTCAQRLPGRREDGRLPVGRPRGVLSVMSSRLSAFRPRALRPLLLPTLIALALISPVAFAQQAPAPKTQPQTQSATGYREPVAELKAIVDAARAPQLSLSPRRDLAALQKIPPLPSIALVAQPELKLAGLRLNPRSYSPSRFSFASDLWLMDVATGKEMRIEGLPQPLSLAAVSWSPTEYSPNHRSPIPASMSCGWMWVRAGARR